MRVISVTKPFPGFTGACEPVRAHEHANPLNLHCLSHSVASSSSNSGVFCAWYAAGYSPAKQTSYEGGWHTCRLPARLLPASLQAMAILYVHSLSLNSSVLLGDIIPGLPKTRTPGAIRGISVVDQGKRTIGKSNGLRWGGVGIVTDQYETTAAPTLREQAVYALVGRVGVATIFHCGATLILFLPATLQKQAFHPEKDVY